jgi:esterase
MKLHVRRLGAGRPLLILHGLFGSGSNWQGIARALATQIEVWLVDLRNHGRSPHADEMSYPALANDVLELLDSERLSPAIILGHSLGGKVAMRLALQEPARVAGLIVADIAPVTYSDRFYHMVKLLQDLPLAEITSRVDADAWLGQWIGDGRLRQFLLQNLEFAEGAYRWRVNLAAIARSLPEVFGFPDVPEGRAYLGPCLFIHGALSNFVRPEHDAVIKAWFPQAVIETLPEAGHWLHADQPQAFIALVEAFLQGASLDRDPTK